MTRGAILELDPATVRALERHETEAHAIGGRELRDLGDGLLLVDHRDPDPFWTRLVSVRWPAAPAAFDRRLAEVTTLFGALGRRPHIWPTAGGDEPADLVERLLAHGFEDTGRGVLMVLPDPADATAAWRSAAHVEASIAIRVVRGSSDDRAAITGSALVLAEAFASHGESDAPVDGRDRVAIEAQALIVVADLERSLADPRVALVFATVDGQPAAAAKVTGGAGLAYLSSIGTRAAFRGKGLGAAVTAAAIAAGVADGAALAYLGVYEGNGGARRVYERLGFRMLGGPVPDLLLVG